MNSIYIYIYIYYSQHTESFTIKTQSNLYNFCLIKFKLYFRFLRIFYIVLVLAGTFADCFGVEQIVVALATTEVEIDALVSVTTIGPLVQQGTAGANFAKLLSTNS